MPARSSSPHICLEALNKRWCVCVCVCACMTSTVQCTFSVHCDCDRKHTPHGQTAVVLCYSKWYTYLPLCFQSLSVVCTTVTSFRFTSTSVSPLNHQLDETYELMNRIFTVLTFLTVVWTDDNCASLPFHRLTADMKQNPSCKAHISSGSQEYSRTFCKPNVRCPVHNSRPLTSL